MAPDRNRKASSRGPPSLGTDQREKIHYGINSRLHQVEKVAGPSTVSTYLTALVDSKVAGPTER